MNESFWRSRAWREALRFNLGWWVQKFLPWVLGAGIFAAVGILALRSAGSPVWLAATAAAGVAVIGTVVSFFLARKKFLNKSEALTRLDADLRLRNRLTAAAQGIGEWPQPREEAALALRWKWSSVMWPPLAAVVLAIVAVFVPLPVGSARTSAAVSEPTSWTATQEKIDILRKDEVAQEEAVDELQKSLEALRKQPTDQWFRHESLEAGDHLQTQLDQSLSELQKNLETALGAMEAARQIEESQMQALSQPLNEALKNSLQGMELGKLPLNPEMLAQLKNLDTSKLRQLSAEEWKQLCENMKKGIGTCSGGLCKGEGAGENLLAAIMAEQGGGVSRGPGAAPLTLKPEETQLGTTKTEQVKNEDLSHASVGDLQGLSEGRHKVDENAWSGPQGGGTMNSTGNGGEAVWQQGATPAEQQALKRFFQ